MSISISKTSDAMRFDSLLVLTRTAFNQRNAHPQSQQLFADYLLKAMP